MDPNQWPKFSADIEGSHEETYLRGYSILPAVWLAEMISIRRSNHDGRTSLVGADVLEAAVAHRGDGAAERCQSGHGQSESYTHKVFDHRC